MSQSPDYRDTVPDLVVPKSKKMIAWNKGLDLIQEVHRDHDWVWEAS